MSWHLHLDAIYRKGYAAGLAGKERVPPYKPSDYVAGVQQQRIKSWMRGFDRAVNGKPLNDSNG